MSDRVLSSIIRTARKEHDCNGAYWIDRVSLSEDDYEQEDWQTVLKIRADNGKIKVGMKYLDTRMIFDGEPCTVRTRLDAHDICIKYELYPDD